MNAAKNIRVLVVDDNPLVRTLVVDGLAGLGEILSAPDGALRYHCHRWYRRAFRRECFHVYLI